MKYFLSSGAIPIAWYKPSWRSKENIQSPFLASLDKVLSVSNLHEWSMQWLLSHLKSITNRHLPPGLGTRKHLETYLSHVASSHAPTDSARSVSVARNSAWFPTNSPSRRETPWLNGRGGPFFHWGFAP